MAAGNLFRIRSATADAAIAWLNRLAKALDETSWSYDGKRILASETAIDCPVYTGRWQNPDEDRRRSPDDRSRETSLIDSSVAKLYEHPHDWERREKMRWSRLMQQHKQRLGVRGSPGSGKSFLTRI